MTAQQPKPAGEWCDRGCDFHWRLSVDSGPLVILRLDSSRGEAYLSPDEADAIGDALKAYARDARMRSGNLRGLAIESHDAGRGSTPRES